MLEYKWSIDNVVVANENGLNNVIKSVHYLVEATDSGSGKSTTLRGSLALSDVVDPNSFIAFDQLTRDTVLNWITTKVDMIELESQAMIQLNAQRASMLSASDLPWSKTL
jgi:ABC-type polar amino acid transport system ATPase subunit